MRVLFFKGSMVSLNLCKDFGIQINYVKFAIIFLIFNENQESELKI